MRNAPYLIQCSNKINIFIGKIAYTVCMFRHGEMHFLPHARRITQHRDRTRRGNSAFPFQLVFRIRSCILSFGAHISSWSRTWDTTLICGLNHGWNRTLSLPSMRPWLLFWSLPCAVTFTLHLASSFDANSATSLCSMLLPSFTSSAFGAINFQFHNNSSFIVFQTEGKSQCLLKTSAGFFFPAMWWIMPAATAYRTRW